MLLLAPYGRSTATIKLHDFAVSEAVMSVNNGTNIFREEMLYKSAPEIFPIE